MPDLSRRWRCPPPLAGRRLASTPAATAMPRLAPARKQALGALTRRAVAPVLLPDSKRSQR